MVITGLERLLHDRDALKNLAKRKTALLVNHTSLTSRFEYSWDALRRSGCPISRIFSPEHGLFGTEQDQVAVDPGMLQGIEVVSLYGHSVETLKPPAEMLADIDLIIFDIQDIGTRYYTYVNTMILFMKALHGTDVEFMIFDRPNPLGGRTVEGPLIDAGYESFVGVEPVPVRHGLTAAEIGLMVKKRHNLDIHLTIVPMENWQRDMHFDHTGCAWIPPSPNMPSLQTALVYPGLCLLEGLNISEGRGTTTPFELFGAPFIDPYALRERLNSFNLEGVMFRPHYFRPTFNKYRGEECGGLCIHVTDRDSFRPFLCGVAITGAAHDLYPQSDFLQGVYEFNDRHRAFDLLAGSSAIREDILAGKTMDEIGRSWTAAEKQFREEKEAYHIYKD